MGEMRVPGALLRGETRGPWRIFRSAACGSRARSFGALGLIKSAAAAVNGELGALLRRLPPRSKPLPKRWSRASTTREFVVDIFQTGSGTSTNMNANEVIARLAASCAGGGVHPNDDVNRAQSSNDVIPSAMHIAAAEAVTQRLLLGDAATRRVADRKAESSPTSSRSAARICRMPCRCAWARSSAAMRGRWRRRSSGSGGARRHLRTAAGRYGGGDRLNAPEGFAAAAIAEIAARTGLPFREAPNHFEAQAAKDAVVVPERGAAKRTPSR